MQAITPTAQATERPRPNLKIGMATLFVILCWAYSPTGVHIALHDYGPAHLALLRFIVASIFMAGVALVMGISLPRLQDLPVLALLGLFAVSLHHTALNYGQQGVSAGAASVLAQTTPLFSTLLAHFVFKERVNARQWACVLCGLFGIAIVAGGDHGLAGLNPQALLIPLAALSWSLYFALQKRHCHRYSGLTIVCYTVWSGTALLLIYAPGLWQVALHASAAANLAVLILGIFPSALAYLAWAYVLAHSNVSRAALALYLIPPTAMSMAAIALAERPGLMVIVGTVIVLASVLALTLSPAIKQKTPSP
ncbi:drug/metabolite transporter (DMT)-like permease [Pseudomonas sp. JUb42]|jgi:drug/metabolite transporter (DMT)-like permease|uniref:DMT family transporter n=1 Tax=Pseudomonas sp. JUb42 TaxID=2940611 RepID=UPI0021691F2E|nr:DMT family transporter [Pseudomonas sp. JUb42]MCS3468827.1 drug/metabolite transporter (DMT)-like permease [Pseudomonas sp. JUb42]